MRAMTVFAVLLIESKRLDIMRPLWYCLTNIKFYQVLRACKMLLYKAYKQLMGARACSFVPFKALIELSQ